MKLTHLLPLLLLIVGCGAKEPKKMNDIDTNWAKYLTIDSTEIRTVANSYALPDTTTFITDHSEIRGIER